MVSAYVRVEYVTFREISLTAAPNDFCASKNPIWNYLRQLPTVIPLDFVVGVCYAIVTEMRHSFRSPQAPHRILWPLRLTSLEPVQLV